MPGVDLPGINAHPAQGTLLMRETFPASGEYETVSRLTNLKGPNVQIGKEDTTSHDSEEGIMQKDPKLVDLGDVTADQFYLPESPVQQRFEADAYARTITRYRLVIRSKQITLGYREGLAFITQLGDEFPSDGGMMKRHVGLTLTGPWPYTAGDPPSS